MLLAIQATQILNMFCVHIPIMTKNYSTKKNEFLHFRMPIFSITFFETLAQQRMTMVMHTGKKTIKKHTLYINFPLCNPKYVRSEPGKRLAKHEPN